MKPSRETALRWLRQAEHDLTIARGHQARGDYSDACFMAEQAAQKALKAFLIAHGRRAISIHAVAQLAERCAQLDPDFTVYVTPGRILDQYYIIISCPTPHTPPPPPTGRGARGPDGSR
jgi:HEPN domain-containing protein